MIKTFRFVALIVVSLSMAMAFCHLMEMSTRLAYEPGLWSRVTNVEGTYRNFGPPIGATIEGSAWLIVVILAVLVRRRPVAFRLTVVAATLMIATQVIWWVFVFPVNNQMLSWSPGSLPEDFHELRNQWEYAHAVRAGVQIAALAALILSVLVDSNEDRAKPSSRRPS